MYFTIQYKEHQHIRNKVLVFPHDPYGPYSFPVGIKIEQDIPIKAPRHGRGEHFVYNGVCEQVKEPARVPQTVFFYIVCENSRVKLDRRFKIDIFKPFFIKISQPH